MLLGMKDATESGKPNRLHGFIALVLHEPDRYVERWDQLRGQSICWLGKKSGQN